MFRPIWIQNDKALKRITISSTRTILLDETNFIPIR